MCGQAEDWAGEFTASILSWKGIEWSVVFIIIKSAAGYLFQVALLLYWSAASQPICAVKGPLPSQPLTHSAGHTIEFAEANIENRICLIFNFLSLDGWMAGQTLLLPFLLREGRFEHVAVAFFCFFVFTPGSSRVCRSVVCDNISGRVVLIGIPFNNNFIQKWKGTCKCPGIQRSTIGWTDNNRNPPPPARRPFRFCCPFDTQYVLLTGSGALQSFYRIFIRPISVSNLSPNGWRRWNESSIQWRRGGEERKEGRIQSIIMGHKIWILCSFGKANYVDLR